MPRRPKDPADEFSHSDLAIASNTTKRSVQLIADDGLLPGDRGIRDLKRICVIGAFVSAGAPMLVAGRLTEKLLWSFNQPDGEMPSGLPGMAVKLRGLPSLPAGREPNDYWWHRDLYCRPDLYRPGVTDRGDIRVEIADREHVYLTYGIGIINPLDPTLPNTSYEGRIEGWGFGSDPRFRSMAELSESDRAAANAKALAAHQNAVGSLSVNTSLAIRNGLDRLATYRAQKAGQSS